MTPDPNNPYSPPQAEPARPKPDYEFGPMTRVRFLVVGMCVLMSVLLYIDRFATTPTTDTILSELKLSKTEFGDAIGAFFLAYALMQIPSGWITDSFGARWMLALYVLCWSLATIGLGFAQGLAAVWTMRLVLGIMQAGAYPTAAGLLKRWIPYTERGLANSIVSMGGRCGLLLSLVLTVPLMRAVGGVTGWQLGNWRAVFAFYGGLGLAWAAAFVWLFRDWPRDHPRCSPAERRWISGDAAEAKVKDDPGSQGRVWRLGLFYALLVGAILGLILVLVAARDLLIAQFGPSLTQLTGSEAGMGAIVNTVPELGGLIGTLALCFGANLLLDRFFPADRHLQLPFRAMAASKEVWLMCAINFFVNIGWILLATWLPQYLIENHGSTLTATIGDKVFVAALITAVVQVAAMCGGLSGGRATDVFVRRFGPTWGRRLPGMCAGLLVCGMYLVVPQLADLWLFVAMMIVIAYTIDFGLGATWASYQDIGGRNVAAILGVGNMCGNLGAAYFGRLIGILADHNQWNAVFYIAAGAMLAAASCWMLFDASRAVVQER
ncbi:MAG TPA: MFS transporter [Pirellulaceae bacterium]|nr:MFS transporter [Pirellulaceae bacterium]